MSDIPDPPAGFKVWCRTGAPDSGWHLEPALPLSAMSKALLYHRTAGWRPWARCTGGLNEYEAIAVPQDTK